MKPPLRSPALSRGRLRPRCLGHRWHHRFNINTKPYINASDPNHPSYKPATAPKWQEIKDYYRNVAVWLARPALQTCIRNGGWIRVLGDYDILITARDLEVVKRPASYFWQLGTFAKDALGRGATQCQSLRWKLDYLIPLDLPFRIDPWGPEPRKPIDPPRGFDFDLFETVLLGAGVHRAREEFGRIEKPQSLLEDDGARLEAVFREGMSRGVEVFREEFNAGCRETARLLERLG